MHRFLLLPLIVGLMGVSTGCSKAARGDRHLQRADQYFGAGKYSEAEIEYINALRLDGKNTHAIKQLALIYHSSGRIARAYPLLTRAAETHPADPEIQLKAAEVQLAVGNANAAFDGSLNLLRSNPTNAGAAIVMAEAVRTTNHLAAATEALEQARKTAGDTAPLLTALAVIQARAGNTQSVSHTLTRAAAADPRFGPAQMALGSWHLAHQDVTNALSAFKRASESAPPRANFPVRYADLLAKAGQVEQGRQILTSITEATPDYLPAWVALGELELSQNQLTNCARAVSRARTVAPEDFNAALLDGRLKLAQQEPEMAIAAFDKMAVDFPKAPKVHFYLAAAYLLKGNDVAAAKALAQSLVLDPENEEALLLQAQLDIRRENPTVAITSLTRLLERKPGLVEAHLLLINAYMRNGEPEQALRRGEQLRRLFPDNAQVPMLIGSIYLSQKKSADARREFERAVQLAPEALQPFEQLVNLDLSDNAPSRALTRIQEKMQRWPKSPVLPVLLARVHWALNETNKVEAALQQAIAIQPEYSAPYLLLAKLYVDSGESAKALKQLQNSIEQNPNDAAALFQMGVIQSDTGDYQAAVATYERVLEINPKFSPALNNIAHLYSSKLPQLDKAIAAARRARDLAPADPFVADTLGWVLFLRGDFSGALSFLQQSADALVQDPEIQYHLGLTYYMLNQPTQAKTVLQRALALDKDFAGRQDAQERLAALNLDTSKSDASTIAAFEERVRQQPSDLVTLIKLGELYQHAGATTKAVALYEDALQKNPRNPSLMKPLALLYAANPDSRDKAVNLLKETYKVSPGDAQVAAALGREVFRSGDHPWALSLLQQASQRLPRDSQVLYDLAWAQLSVGRVANAETTMRQALEANPGFSGADEAKLFAELTASLNGKGGVTQSLPRVNEVLKDQPDHLAAMALKGMAQRERGESVPAIQTFEQILKQYPGFLPATKELAQLYTAENPGSAKANEFAAKARTAFPSDPEAAKTLGIVSYARKDYSRAASLLKESSLKRPQDGEVFFYLGMAQHSLKQRTECQDSLRKALALNLSPNLAEEAKRTLETSVAEKK
ncbi:MAG TPA: tetratricopeptide repeat protein [Verrucomicrobiae bacterium]|nr:tetratricopeptide repeat protein [Verrucomicrobiae bacterium]